MAAPLTRTFEDYFIARTAVAGAQPATGDAILVLRSGVVQQALEVHNQASMYVAANAVTTTIALVDQWTAIGGTLLEGTANADVWTYAANQLTYIGPSQVKAALILANVTLTKAAAGVKDYEIGLFANDVLIQNGVRGSLNQNESLCLSCAALFALSTGDALDVRVRSRLGTDTVTITDVQVTVAP